MKDILLDINFKYDKSNKIINLDYVLLSDDIYKFKKEIILDDSFKVVQSNIKDQEIINLIDNLNIKHINNKIRFNYMMFLNDIFNYKNSFFNKDIVSKIDYYLSINNKNYKYIIKNLYYLMTQEEALKEYIKYIYLDKHFNTNIELLTYCDFYEYKYINFEILDDLLDFFARVENDNKSSDKSAIVNFNKKNINLYHLTSEFLSIKLDKNEQLFLFDFLKEWVKLLNSDILYNNVYLSNEQLLSLLTNIKDNLNKFENIKDLINQYINYSFMFDLIYSFKEHTELPMGFFENN